MEISGDIEIVSDLARRFTEVDASSIFSNYADQLVHREDHHYFEPYVPLIGLNYQRPRGLLVYATAQNLTGDANGIPIPGEQGQCFAFGEGNGQGKMLFVHVILTLWALNSSRNNRVVIAKTGQGGYVPMCS